MKRLSVSEIYSELGDNDVFICCSSFENRCLEVANKLNISQFRYVIICHFEDNYIEANRNLNRLKELCGAKCGVIELSKENPLKNYDNIFDGLSKLVFDKVLLDISTFTREMFLIIIRLFAQQPFKKKSLTICYNPSDKYSSVSDEDIRSLWLSKGVMAIRSVIGYAGDLSPIKENLLVVLVGFEAERSQILIDSFEPEKLYIGHASAEESVNPEVATINAENSKVLLSQNGGAHEFVFSCKDIDLTKRELIKIIEENKDKYNIIVSPMCNKISTLAVASVAFAYPEVQVCYASANLYNTNAYSTSAGHIYVIEATELYTA